MVGSRGFALVLALVLAGGSASAAAPAHRLSETEAARLLMQRVERDGLYRAFASKECLFVVTEAKSRAAFDLAVHERHDAHCPGDPATEPVIDRFRVQRVSKKLLWYDVTNDDYQAYDRKKILRQR